MGSLAPGIPTIGDYAVTEDFTTAAVSYADALIEALEKK
jgi:hypothetical protein